MAFKEREKLFEMERLTALFRRTPERYEARPMIERDLKMKQSEITGEKEVDYRLGFLDEEQYVILHNMRLEDRNGYFQIDSLILTESFCIVIEVKNWQGTIVFGENGQVTRRTEERGVGGFQNPIAQVKTQVYRLERWFENHQISPLPIYSFVVMSNPATIIDTATPELSPPAEVIHSQELLFKIKELEKKPHKLSVSRSQLMKTANLMKKKHTPLSRDVLEHYHLSVKDLMKGVFCPMCKRPAMKRKRQQWFCPSCQHYSKVAHYTALKDYLLLIDSQITNQKAREFLMVESRDVTKGLLMNGGYQLIGKKKSSKYQLTFKHDVVMKRNFQRRRKIY